MLGNIFGKFLPSFTVLAETEDPTQELQETFIQGLQTVLPWLGGCCAVVCLGITIWKIVQYVLSKNTGNDQGAEKAKSGIIWGIVGIVVCTIIALLVPIIQAIAGAFTPAGA